MKSCPARESDCRTCTGRMVCRCLQVTEEVLLETLTAFELRTVTEVRQHTGAGDGCTACHRLLRQYLERHRKAEAQSASASAVPI